MNRSKAAYSTLLCFLLAGCSYFSKLPESTKAPADFTPGTNMTSELRQLPQPRGPVTVAVYGFRDQTGQYKQAPDSSFSTAVSQGGGAFLVKALSDSGWFVPVEREGLQNLLTERKIFRSIEAPAGSNNVTASKDVAAIPNLLPANLIIEGAVVGYDFNVSTGGIGVKYLGISAAQQFRKDQVTVNLRAIDTNTGKILHSVSTTKTIYSTLIQPGVYRFVSYRELLEAEVGYTSNEPVQMAVQEAIEAAVIGMVVEGIFKRSWLLARPDDINDPWLRNVYAKMGNGPASPSVATASVSAPPTFGANRGKAAVGSKAADPESTLFDSGEDPAAEATFDDGNAARYRFDVLPKSRIDTAAPATVDKAIEAVVQARGVGSTSPAAVEAPPADSFVDVGRE